MMRPVDLPIRRMDVSYYPPKMLRLTIDGVNLELHDTKPAREVMHRFTRYLNERMLWSDVLRHEIGIAKIKPTPLNFKVVEFAWRMVPAVKAPTRENLEAELRAARERDDRLRQRIVGIDFSTGRDHTAFVQVLNGMRTRISEGVAKALNGENRLMTTVPAKKLTKFYIKDSTNLRADEAASPDNMACAIARARELVVAHGREFYVVQVVRKVKQQKPPIVVETIK